MLLTLILDLYPYETLSQKNDDYTLYHQKTIVAEKLIGQERFADALKFYDTLIGSHDYVFLRDFKIATQLALSVGQDKKAASYLRQAVLGGWKMKEIRKNKFLDPLQATDEFKHLSREYKSLRATYEASLDAGLRKRVKKMASSDQSKAFGALFTFSSTAQDRYAENKFAPHSEKQMAELKEILKVHGYPGERLIGNDFWMSTILSHHNSISKDYNFKDTIYPALKPRLVEALAKGMVSPFELALIDEWYRAVKSGRTDPAGYGILDPPSREALQRFDALRETVFLRPIELRNRLVEIQQKTGMNFYLPGEPWVKGKVEAVQNE